MQIYVQQKTLGKKKPLAKVPLELPDSMETVSDFLREIVLLEVRKYNEKEPGESLLPFLTEEEIRSQAEAGKVGFGAIYNEKKADPEKAVQNALQCFADGLVRIFQNEKEIKAEEERIELKEGDTFTFIRMTFLAGRLW